MRIASKRISKNEKKLDSRPQKCYQRIAMAHPACVPLGGGALGCVFFYLHSCNNTIIHS